MGTYRFDAVFKHGKTTVYYLGEQVNANDIKEAERLAKKLIAKRHKDKQGFTIEITFYNKKYLGHL